MSVLFMGYTRSSVPIGLYYNIQYILEILIRKTRAPIYSKTIFAKNDKIIYTSIGFNFCLFSKMDVYFSPPYIEDDYH